MKKPNYSIATKYLIRSSAMILCLAVLYSIAIGRVVIPTDAFMAFAVMSSLFVNLIDVLGKISHINIWIRAITPNLIFFVLLIFIGGLMSTNSQNTTFSDHIEFVAILIPLIGFLWVMVLGAIEYFFIHNKKNALINEIGVFFIKLF